MMMIKVTNNNCGSGLREISLFSFKSIHIKTMTLSEVELVARGVEKRNKKEWYAGLTFGIREFHDALKLSNDKFLVYANSNRKEIMELFLKHDFYID